MPPIPECDDCRFKLWPATCRNAAGGIARKCDLIHSLGRRDYEAGLDREMTGVPHPTQGPEPDAPGPARPCGGCGRADTAKFFGDIPRPE